MVEPGTIAPFRAFMEQRVHDKSKGRLASSATNRNTPSTTRNRSKAGWTAATYRFTTAWSRDQEEDLRSARLKEHGAEIWEWFDNGAYFYICGDGHMAKGVHRALIEIAMEHGGMSDGRHFIEKTMMKDEKRYLRDVY